jgi:hypothetical protein
LELLGFLRRVAEYPAVYQVTKSTTRHLERDSGARRRHPLSTVQARLLAVDFYLAARKWPAKFILDHKHKIAAFVGNGCPVGVPPQRGENPYLREDFVLWLTNGRLGVAMVDQPYLKPLSQMLGLIHRFSPAIPYLGEASLELLIVTGCERRQYLYGGCYSTQEYKPRGRATLNSQPGHIVCHYQHRRSLRCCAPRAIAPKPNPGHLTITRKSRRIKSGARPMFCRSTRKDRLSQ